MKINNSVKINVPIWIDIIVILVVAAFSRLLLFSFNTEVGDTKTYELLAENILRGCGLSFSDPKLTDCILTSGNYFPGYPAFIALNWFLFGHSTLPILLFQTVCYLLSLYWLLIAVCKFTNSRKAVLSVGILLAVSPLQIGWFRFVLTEPLALAGATWFLAELVMSIAIGKIRKYHLALALSASTYIRPDTILMSFGVIFVAIYLYDIKNALKQILLVGIMASIPISGWMIRNLTIGHAPLTMISEVAPKAPGYFSWLNTWVVNEYERADTNFPVWRAEYSKINLHHSKYVSYDERKYVQSLINELITIDGKPFPIDIDQKFGELASEKIKNQSQFNSYGVYIERVFWLLFNPFSSWGLPFEIKDVNRSLLNDAIVEFDFTRVISMLDGYKAIIVGKIMTFAYRIIIFIIFIIIVCFVFINRISAYSVFNNFAIKSLFAGVVAVVVTRLSFFAYIGGLESRYLVEVVPWIEVCVVLCLVCNARSFNSTKTKSQ